MCCCCCMFGVYLLYAVCLCRLKRYTYNTSMGINCRHNVCGCFSYSKFPMKTIKKERDKGREKAKRKTKEHQIWRALKRKEQMGIRVLKKEKPIQNWRECMGDVCSYAANSIIISSIVHCAYIFWLCLKNVYGTPENENNTFVWNEKMKKKCFRWCLSRHRTTF